MRVGRSVPHACSLVTRGRFNATMWSANDFAGRVTGRWSVGGISMRADRSEMVLIKREGQ